MTKAVSFMSLARRESIPCLKRSTDRLNNSIHLLSLARLPVIRALHNYSYLSASIGFRFAARIAGIRPNNTPIAMLNVTARSTVLVEM